MSDPKYGEPVGEESTRVDDVVGSANEGLAEAEATTQGQDDRSAFEVPADGAPSEGGENGDAAASHNDFEAFNGVDDRPVSDPSVNEEYRPVAEEPVVTEEEVITEEEAPVREDAQPVEETGATPADSLSRYDSEDDSLAYINAHPSTVQDDAPVAEETRVTPVADDAQAQTVALPPVTNEPTPAATDDAPTTAAPTAVAPAAAQPIFVQAPEAPLPRGNRGAAGAIGLLAALVFGILYLAAALGLGALNGETTVDTLAQDAIDALTSFWFWVPVAVFFIAFWLLGAIINRGRWGHWVIWGLLVGVAAYGGHLLGALFQAPFWNITPSEATTILEAEALAPLAIVAFVLGRELTIWFGAWVAARGRRVTELNNEAQREYERTLEAGPRLHAS